MATSLQIDMRRAFSYFADDKRWPIKLGLLFAFGWIPGLNLIAWVGYTVSIAHNIARGQRDPLPSWDSWADIFVRGLVTLCAGLVYFLPILVLGCGLSVLSLIGGRESANTALLLAAARCCGGVGGLLYSLFALLLLSASSAHYARTDQYSGFFAVRARLRGVSTRLSVYGVGFVYQTLLMVVVAVLLLPSLLTVAGPGLVLAAFCVVNGFVLGNVARVAR